MAIKFPLTFSSPGYIVSNPNSFCLFSQGLFLKRSPLSHTPWNQFQVFPISIHYHHPPGAPAHACGPCSNLYMQESSCGPTPRTWLSLQSMFFQLFPVTPSSAHLTWVIFLVQMSVLRAAHNWHCWSTQQVLTKKWQRPAESAPREHAPPHACCSLE